MLKQREDEIRKEFAGLNDWEDRYRLLIEWGKKLPELSQDLMTEKYIVKGCQSQVWLHSQLQPDGKIHWQSDSDALFVKGLVSLVLFLVQDLTADELLNYQFGIFKDLDLQQNLTPSRANGLNSLIQQMKREAMVYKLTR